MLTTEPPPPAIISGMTCFDSRKTVFRLAAMTRSHSASGMPTTVPWSSSPVQLNSPVTWPELGRGRRHAPAILVPGRSPATVWMRSAAKARQPLGIQIRGHDDGAAIREMQRRSPPDPRRRPADHDHAGQLIHSRSLPWHSQWLLLRYYADCRDRIDVLAHSLKIELLTYLVTLTTRFRPRGCPCPVDRRSFLPPPPAGRQARALRGEGRGGGGRILNSAIDTAETHHGPQTRTPPPTLTLPPRGEGTQRDAGMPEGAAVGPA